MAERGKGEKTKLNVYLGEYMIYEFFVSQTNNLFNLIFIISLVVIFIFIMIRARILFNFFEFYRHQGKMCYQGSDTVGRVVTN